MTYGLGMRRIVLPQALRVILPPTGNEFNNMLKSSSLASVISVGELLQHADNRGDRKSTRLNSSHSQISYAVFCLKKKKHHTVTDSMQRSTDVAYVYIHSYARAVFAIAPYVHSVRSRHTASILHSPLLIRVRQRPY